MYHCSVLVRPLKGHQDWIILRRLKGGVQNIHELWITLYNHANFHLVTKPCQWKLNPSDNDSAMGIRCEMDTLECGTINESISEFAIQIRLNCIKCTESTSHFVPVVPPWQINVLKYTNYKFNPNVLKYNKQFFQPTCTKYIFNLHVLKWLGKILP